MQSHPADACVAHLSDLGFRAFELMVYPGHLWPRDDGLALLAPLKRALAGLHLVTLNMPNIDINIGAAAPEMRRYSLELIADIVRCASELGAEGVVVGPGKPNPLFPAPRDELQGHFFRALDVLAPLAERSGTALWLENMPFAYLPAIDAMMTTLDTYGHDRIGIVYDVANAHFIGEDIAAGLQRCRTRLKLVHLSDTGRHAYRHDPIGTGTVPFAAIPAALTAVGYRDVPMLEIISSDPDRDIVQGVTLLAEAGFARPA